MNTINKVKGRKRAIRTLCKIAETIDIGDYVAVHKIHNQYKVITYYEADYGEPYIVYYKYKKGIPYETPNYLKKQ